MSKLIYDKQHQAKLRRATPEQQGQAAHPKKKDLDEPVEILKTAYIICSKQKIQVESLLIFSKHL